VTAERALDVRSLPPSAASAEVLARFDSLSSGARFVLVADGAMAGLLRRLQADRPGLFEWSPLASGPPTWRVEIVRRETSVPGPRGVNEALS
jgi:uncharacterized protein (DUF2249 family)